MKTGSKLRDSKKRVAIPDQAREIFSDGEETVSKISKKVKFQESQLKKSMKTTKEGQTFRNELQKNMTARKIVISSNPWRQKPITTNRSKSSLEKQRSVGKKKPSVKSIKSFSINQLLFRTSPVVPKAGLKSNRSQSNEGYLYKQHNRWSFESKL